MGLLCRLGFHKYRDAPVEPLIASLWENGVPLEPQQVELYRTCVRPGCDRIHVVLNMETKGKR